MPHPSHLPSPDQSRPARLASLAPVTAWRLTPGGDASKQAPAHVGTTVAERLISTYTRPTGAVIALDHPYVTGLAAQWLSRHATLIVTQRHHQEALESALHSRLDPVRRNLVRVLHRDPQAVPAALHAIPGSASLVIAGVPEPGHPINPDIDLRELIAGAAHALTGDGFLAVTATSIDTRGRFTDTISDTIAIARAHGLHYHDHLIAISDRLYSPPSAVARRKSRATRSGDAMPRTHVDVLILAALGATNV